MMWCGCGEHVDEHVDDCDERCVGVVNVSMEKSKSAH